MSGTHSQSSELSEGLGHFFGSASAPHTLSTKFSLALFHCCCSSWWSFHGTCISKTARVLWFNLAAVSAIASYWFSSGTPARNTPPSLHSFPYFALCLQTQQHLDDPNNTKCNWFHKVQHWLLQKHVLSVFTLRTHFPKDFASMILICM